MQKRKLGNSDTELSALGLGCMGFSNVYGKADDEQSIKTLHRSLELGINFWDTADVYGFGHNEELIGKALKGKRNQVFISTKFALSGISNSPGGITANGRPEYVKSSCEKSLLRLGIDTIDLYFQHRVDPKTPIEVTIGAMADLVKEGKVRYIGLSEASPASILRAHAVHPISALQTEYSIWSLDVENEILPLLKNHGISLIAYSPLGRGFLTGQIKSPDDFEDNDWRKIAPRFQGENFYKNLELVKKLEKMAKSKNCTTAQLALAWVLAQDEQIIPIPGTRRISALEENAGSLKVDLSSSELRTIREMIPSEIAGHRYPERASGLLNL